MHASHPSLPPRSIWETSAAVHTGNPLIGHVCLQEKLKHLLSDSMFLLRTLRVQRVERGVCSGYKASVAVPHPLLAAWHRRIGDLVR